MVNSKFVSLVAAILILNAGPLKAAPVAESGGILQDDIMYPINLDRQNYAVNLWTNRIVPYVMTVQHPYIQQAMLEIQKQTCITFRPRTNEREFIRFTSLNQGCWSWIGKQYNTYNGQEVNIGLECFQKGTVVHEILHALGLFHEQTRPDRDSYVQINWNNIAPYAQQNFYIQNGYTLQNSQPYDFNSIMHYGPYDFARYPSAPTMLPRQMTGTIIGQRNGLSAGDISRIKSMYGCT